MTTAGSEIKSKFPASLFGTESFRHSQMPRTPRQSWRTDWGLLLLKPEILSSSDGPSYGELAEEPRMCLNAHFRSVLLYSPLLPGHCCPVNGKDQLPAPIATFSLRLGDHLQASRWPYKNYTITKTHRKVVKYTIF